MGGRCLSGWSPHQCVASTTALADLTSTQCGHRSGDGEGVRNARGSRAVEGGVPSLNPSAQEPRWRPVLPHSTYPMCWSSRSPCSSSPRRVTAAASSRRTSVPWSARYICAGTTPSPSSRPARPRAVQSSSSVWICRAVCAGQPRSTAVGVVNTGVSGCAVRKLGQQFLGTASEQVGLALNGQCVRPLGNGPKSGDRLAACLQHPCPEQK